MIVITYSMVFGNYLVMTILHPRQIPDFLYGASYPFTLPFMFMILPLYCLFNMDDVSWGTREAKNPNKSFKKPEGAAARDEKSIQWTFDIFQNPVQPASPEEENFWKKTIEEFLKPRKPTEEEEDVMKKDLRLMKIGAIIVLSLFYIGYVLLMVLKKEYPLPSHLSINWKLCSSNEPMDFIDMSLFAFVFAVTGFLIVGTFLHRVETLSHIIRTTSVRKKSSDEEGKIEDTVTVSHVDTDIMA